jgi:small subunit ribosomal protein S2
VLEARKLGVPVIAIVDTNCDPEIIDYPIPGNDDAIRAIELIVNLMSSAFIEGRQGVDGNVSGEGEPEEIAVEEEVIEIREKLHDEYSEVGEKVVNQEMEERKGWKESL